jgi:molybdopterin-guanine dinucleotide biosynthesis protein A
MRKDSDIALTTGNMAGVILAGGAGKRLNGIIKSNIVIEGKTIISRILEAFEGIFEETIIVTNSPQEFYDYTNCRITSDLFLNKGPLGGIHSAMTISDKEALFVVAGDMPLLDRDIIIRQADYYLANKCEALIPRINNYMEPLHGIYSKALLPALEDYLEKDNDRAIRNFLKMLNVCYLQFEDSIKYKSAFTNINTLSDVIKVEKFLARHE